MCVLRFILLFAALGIMLCTRAQPIQKITAARYFFDKDSGVTKGKPLKIGVSDTVVTIINSLSVGQLKPGFHTLCIRVKETAAAGGAFWKAAAFILPIVRSYNPP